MPCVVADDLTPDQIRAFRLVDNKTSELTGWDNMKLNIELEELELDLSGFDLTQELEIPEADEDEDPED